MSTAVREASDATSTRKRSRKELGFSNHQNGVPDIPTYHQIIHIPIHEGRIQEEADTGV